MEKKYPYPKNRRKRGQGMTQAERDALWLQRHPKKHRETQKKWRKKNPDKAYAIVKASRKRDPLRFRGVVIKGKYGITNETYDEMLKVFCGGCWICDRKPLPGKPRLAIDHEHLTKVQKKAGLKFGKVRGLLCFRCNKYVIGRSKTMHAPLYLRAYKYLLSEKDWRLT